LDLPLLECLPENVGQEADKNVSLDAFLLLVPDGSDGEVALVDTEGGLGVGELDVGLPESVL